MHLIIFVKLLVNYIAVLMHKPIITEDVSLSRSLPRKTICFTESPLSSRRHSSRGNEKRVQSSKIKTNENVVNL